MGNREKLLDGAKQCLFEKGYAQTTARDIAAASGANLASIGYHYGSVQALMNAAMLQAIEEWGDAVGLALAAHGDEQGDPLAGYWRRVLSTLGEHRDLWVASVEAMLVAERQTDLRQQMADGVEQGRSGLAAIITGTAEESLDEETIRTVGSVTMALMSGVLIQWLVDPARAPGPDQVAAGLRALAKI